MKESVRNYYLNSNKNNHYKGLNKYFRNKIHKLMEKDFNSEKHFDKVIEFGALYGEHLKFINHSFKTYYETDILTVNKTSRNFNENSEIVSFKLDATNLDEYEDKFFDRIISTCLLVHLENPETVLAGWKRVVKKDGVLTLWVHLEPSILLNIAQKINSRGREDFYDVHFDEHLTYYKRIDYFINKIFSKDHIKKSYFPFKFLSWNFNLVAVYQIKIL